MKNENDKHNFTIRKVPLHALLNLLNNLYMDGADYVDLHGELDDEGMQDNVTVAVPLDYLSEDAQEKIEERASAEPGPQPPPGLEEANVEEPGLSEEDVTDLLNNA